MGQWLSEYMFIVVLFFDFLFREMSDAVNNSSSETENLEVNNKSPLWNYVTVIVAAKKSYGGNCTFKCSFCNTNYTKSPKISFEATWTTLFFLML